MSIGLFPFVMDAVATVARSWDFHREMFGCERHQKNLRRTSALIRRLRPGCVGIAQVADGRDVKISADLRCAQVARHRDEVDGGKFAHDFLAAKWRRKFPPRSRYLVTRRKHFDSAILENNAASGSALTGQACSA